MQFYYLGTRIEIKAEDDLTYGFEAARNEAIKLGTAIIAVLDDADVEDGPYLAIGIGEDPEVSVAVWGDSSSNESYTSRGERDVDDRVFEFYMAQTSEFSADSIISLQDARVAGAGISYDREAANEH